MIRKLSAISFYMLDHHSASPTLSLANNSYILYANLVDTLYQRIMNCLHQTGYQGLKLSHALILLQLSDKGARISDIASSQAVSKQAIGQIATELEHLGFIQKLNDPNDKRAKRIMISSQGIVLVRKAASFLLQVEQQLAEEIGEQSFLVIRTHSKKLFKHLRLPFPNAGSYTQDLKQTPLISYASAISTHLQLQLLNFAQQNQHPILKRSVWQILYRIQQQASSINDLAIYSHISKQAVSQLANDLEKNAYICRIAHPNDKRSRLLVLSSQGIAMIKHLLTSLSAMEQQLCQYLSLHDFQQLQTALQCLSTTTLEPQGDNIVQEIQLALTNILRSSPEKDRWIKNDRLSAYALEALAQIHLP